MEKKKSVWVIGHKNPDTDSICAAIAYAHLKNKTGDTRYEARRAGQINEESKYVLEHFGIPSPAYVADVGAQVKILAPPGVQQGHVQHHNVDLFLLGENPPLILNFLIISPQPVDALDVEQIVRP